LSESGNVVDASGGHGDESSREHESRRAVVGVRW
jgi:hypothetical protein